MRAPLLSGIALTLVGCSASVTPAPESTEAEAGPVVADIVLERTSSVLGGEGRTESVARFFRLRGVGSESLLRAMGVGLDLPPRDACAVTPLGELGDVQPGSHVEFLDLGSVAIEVDGKRNLFARRRIPDIVEWSQGVVYTSRDALAPRGNYTLSVGSGAIGGTADRSLDGSADATKHFDINVEFSGEPAGVRIDGEDPGGSAGELFWDITDGSNDLVYVDITDRKTPSMRCTFADVGHAKLHDLPTDGTLTLHRVHRESFHAAGIDSGEIRFDFARSVSLRKK